MSLAARFLALAKDPAIIPGVHHHCDEWCDHCAVTSRCFGFRCTVEFRKYRGRRRGDPTFESIEEAATFTREMSLAEGVATPELDMLLAGSAEEAGLHTVDPLAGLAWDYALGVAVVMTPAALRRGTTSSASRQRQPEARAEDIVLWYHLRIYFRLVRALVARERYDAALGGQLDDAMGSAKLVLVSAERSREALRTLEGRMDPAEIAPLIALLDNIERGIDDRIPDARRYIRVGLDVPLI